MHNWNDDYEWTHRLFFEVDYEGRVILCNFESFIEKVDVWCYLGIFYGGALWIRGIQLILNMCESIVKRVGLVYTVVEIYFNKEKALVGLILIKLNLDILTSIFEYWTTITLRHIEAILLPYICLVRL